MMEAPPAQLYQCVAHPAKLTRDQAGFRNGLCFLSEKFLLRLWRPKNFQIFEFGSEL